MIEIISKFPSVLNQVSNINNFLKILDSFKDNFSILIIILVAYYIKDKDEPPEFYPFSIINSEILTYQQGKFISMFVNSLPETIKDAKFLLSTEFINNIQALSQFKINYSLFKDNIDSFDNAYKILKINVETLKNIGASTLSSVSVSSTVGKLSKNSAAANLIASTLKPRNIPIDSGEYDGAGPAFLEGIQSGVSLKKTVEDKKEISKVAEPLDPVLLKYKEYIVEEFNKIKNVYDNINKIQKENLQLIKNIFELLGEDTKSENINTVINVILKISNQYFNEYNISKEMLYSYLKEINLNPDGKNYIINIKRPIRSKSKSKSKRRYRSKSKSKSKRRYRSKSKSKRRYRSKSKSKRRYRSKSKSKRRYRSKSKSKRRYRSKSKK